MAGAGCGPEELFRVALEVLRTNTYGFLNTIAEEGPHTRLVQHLAVDDDGGIWVGTSPRSRKSSDIARCPAISYAVEDRSAVAYVALQADASIVADKAMRAAKWTDGLEAFFPEGPEGDDFVLVHLRPHRIELMHFASGIHPEPFGLVPAVIERRDSTWHVVSAPRGSSEKQQ